MSKAQFQDQVMLITGGSDGIGRALVVEMLSRGANVATCARDLKKLEAALQDMASNRLLLMACDVTNNEQCAAFVAAAASRWGRVDVLVNNAGASMRALFKDVDLSVIRRLMEVNFFGAVQCTKAALPHILRSRGTIVGISSIAGYRGLPARTAYSASKFALQGFLEALRTELLPTGTHVMWVSPGFTASNIRNTALDATGRPQQESPLNEGNLMSAEDCARVIANAVTKRKRTVVMTGQGKLTVWLNKLWPALADRLVYRHFQKEADSPLES